MCNGCCKEFKGWCKSFTKTEAFLTLLEAILLLVFIGFLTFLILHFLACSKPEINFEIIQPIPFEHPNQTTTVIPVPTAKTVIYLTPSRAPSDKVEVASTKRETLAPDKQCSWTPSQKTTATTHYYEYAAPASRTTATVARLATSARDNTHATLLIEEKPAGMEDSDGEEVEEGVESVIIALVKIHPMRESTFGCVLTVVSRYWTLTAASCLEAVEEVDSLDAFVMVEGWGAGAAGATHAVADVRVHPEYPRAGGARDVAALRSEDALAEGPQGPLQLPTVLDHLLVTIGERMTILGYGRFRTFEKSTSGRGVRAVAVYTLAAGACAGAGEGEGGWAPRHLAGGAPALPATGEIGPLCAGPLFARGGACNYCAGTPLLRARELRGLRAGACGACEPAAFVSLAAVQSWRSKRSMNKVLLAGSVVMALFVAGTIGTAIMQLVAGAEAGHNKTEDYDA